MLTRVMSPIRIGGVLIPNRIVRTAHVTNMCERGRISERFIAYHEARARGGVGLTILEGASVHPSSIFHPNTLTVFDDSVIAGYAQLKRRLSPYPMRLFQQLWHGGYNAGAADGSPPWSASDLPGPILGVPAEAMTSAQVAQIILAYAAAAKRVAAGGLDGCEVHAAHGYLIGQFLAPATNKRTDEYGGAFENRIRLLLQILRSVRASVPEGFVVGVRLGPELAPGGVTVEDVAAIVNHLDAEQLVDYYSFSVSNYNTVHKAVGTMEEPAGYELRWTGELKRHTLAPVLVTGRVRALEEAERILAGGAADLVGMTRAHIAEPAIVAKTMAGRASEVRPCIACNQMCIGGMFGPSGEVGCVVNPAVGRETHWDDAAIDRSPHPRHVMIVGGGPGGMQAARTAALRGHRVTLHEACAELGGMARLAADIAPNMEVFGDITRWLEREIVRLGVQIQRNSTVTAEVVARTRPDALIVATGVGAAEFRQTSDPGSAVPGIDGPNVYSTMDLFDDKSRAWAGGSVVVVDEVGHYEAIAVSEYLLSLGANVYFVTRHAAFAPLMAVALRSAPALERLRRARFHLRTQATVREVTLDHVVIEHGASENREQLPAQCLVHVPYHRANDSLTRAIGTAVDRIFVVGDARSQRFLSAAIHEGHRAALEVA
jgi:2,4-dienoyl-CoA reductase-like NADH-dependent reductase (Old Yellow Enzyme family)/thioredoxin reductase